MEVILLEKVPGKGNLGDIVRVRDGYARNWLIPQKKAQRATAAAKEAFEARRAELEKVQADKLAAAQSVGERLSGQQVKILQKAGVDGRLFGSVTNVDIVEALHKAGFDTVEKLHVRLPSGPLRPSANIPSRSRCTPTWWRKSPCSSKAISPDVHGAGGRMLPRRPPRTACPGPVRIRHESRPGAGFFSAVQYAFQMNSTGARV
jgi:large subunit ribosomal protein L9